MTLNTAQVYGPAGAPITVADVGPVSVTLLQFMDLLERQLNPVRESP